MEDTAPTKDQAPGKRHFDIWSPMLLGTDATEATDQTKASATPTPARQGTLPFQVSHPPSMYP